MHAQQVIPSGGSGGSRGSCPPRLRIFNAAAAAQADPAAAGPPRVSPRMQLREFFEHWFVPEYCHQRRRPLKAATEREFSTAVARWIELIGNLPLREITTDLCRLFVEADLAMAGRKAKTLSAYTVSKHVVALSTILAQAGPRSRRTPDAATDDGLFGLDKYGRPRDVPWFPPIAKPAPQADDVFEIEEIRAWLAACTHARHPRLTVCTPAAWWRALILFLYNSGLRIGAALQLRRDMLRQTGGDWWLDLPGTIGKHNKAAEICLSTHAMRALDSLPTTDLIFPWPHCTRHLHTIRLELLEAAGLPPERRFGFHALRGANGSELYEIDPAAAQTQLDHEQRTTTERHYVRRRSKVAAKARAVRPALEALPQPIVTQQPLLF